LNKTILMVTHDPLTSEYASRVLHLDKGRLAEQNNLHEEEVMV
jgi:putative ABC transport system ATP-binding protein